MSTDGNPDYLNAIEAGIIPENRGKYGILKKTYKMENGKRNTKNLNIDKIPVIGEPKEKHIATGYVERYNGTLRNNVRRFTRKTYGFSKKFENHEHHVSLFYMYYNFVRPHATFGRNVTPAMVAGISDRKWELSNVLDLVNHESETGFAAVA